MLLQVFSFIAVVFDLLLCLIYKLKFIIDMYVQKKKNQQGFWTISLVDWGRLLYLSGGN